MGELFWVQLSRVVGHCRIILPQDFASMLDIQFIRDNADIVRAAIKNKNREGIDLDRILALADERKKAAGEITEINRQRNEAQAARDGEAGKRLKDELKAAEEKYQTIEKEL